MYSRNLQHDWKPLIMFTDYIHNSAAYRFIYSNQFVNSVIYLSMSISMLAWVEMYMSCDRVMHDLLHELLINLVVNFHEIESITITCNQLWLYNIICILLKFASSMKICKFILYESHRILWKFKILSKLLNMWYLIRNMGDLYPKVSPN